jgi:glycosyl transferase family 25
MSDISIFKEYYFIQDKDSNGNDIDYNDSIDINYLKNIADNNNDCIAFNTWGYFKNKISSLDNFINLNNRYNLKYNGLFIKKSKYNLDKDLSKNKLQEDKIIEIKIIKDKLLPIICLNLERREDRKNNMIKLFEKKNIKNYEFFNAVDCKKLQPTEFIKNYFEGNKHNYNKAIIACALSHLNMWKKLINDPNNEAYIILEDDINIVDNFDYFNMQLNNIIEDKMDIIFIGYSKINKKIKKVSLYDLELKIQPLNMTNYCMGGTIGYIITKKGAKILLDSNKIIYPIDWEIAHNKKLKLYETNFELVNSDYVTNTNNVDSDIQYNHDVFNFNEIKEDQIEIKQVENNSKIDILLEKEKELKFICKELIENNDEIYLIINESDDINNKFSYLNESIMDKIENIIINKIKNETDIDIIYIGYYIDPIELYSNYEKYNTIGESLSIKFQKTEKLDDKNVYAYYITKNAAKKIVNESNDLSYYLLCPRLLY